MNHLIRFLLIATMLCPVLAPTVRCQDKALSKPEANFEELWKLFDENYAFFQDKHIDWQKAYNIYRAKVTASTSDTELFDIFTEMLAPLNDAHVTLKNADGQRFSASRPSRILEEFAKTEGAKKSLYYDMINATLQRNGFNSLKETGPEFNDVSLFYFSTNERYGYLRFNRCFATAINMKGFRTQHYLDEIFEAFKGKEGVIIDIRFNMGGEDKFAYEVAGRFTNDPFLGHYKQVKNGKAHDQFTPLEPFHIEPQGDVRFLKPVVLITNDKTVSAADVFTLVMSELPQVTVIGENSNGSFSDLMSEKLSNGWRVTLSNQRYLSAEKQNYEGVGVPVDIEVKNMLVDLDSMNDTVLIRAIEELDNEKVE